MTTDKKLKMWMTVLVEIDMYGNAVITQSFMNPAKDSDIKRSVKKSTKIGAPVEVGEKSAWD